MKYFFNISRFLIGLVIILIATSAFAGVATIVAFQSQDFRAWLIQKGGRFLEPKLLGKIEVEDITGNPVFGLKLHNVKIFASNKSRVLFVPQVDINYQLMPFIKKNIFGKVYLHNPEINISRDEHDSTWNIAQIFKPDTIPSKPFDYNIELSSLEIENGSIALQDNLELRKNITNELNKSDFTVVKTSQIAAPTNRITSNKKLGIISNSKKLNQKISQKNWSVVSGEKTIFSDKLKNKSTKKQAIKPYSGDFKIQDNINYSDIKLQDLNLSLSAKINKDEQTLVLQNLRFYLPKSDIRVRELIGNFLISPNGISVEGLRLETDKTLLDITASVDSLNLLNPDNMKNWKKYPVHIRLNSPRVSTTEIKKFLPVLDFLNGSPSLELDATGNYGSIDIRRLSLGLNSSKLNLSGKLLNLNEPEKLFIDAKISETMLSHKDVREYIPGLPIPNLEYLGNVVLREAKFVGEPLNFTAEVDATTAIGGAKGGAKLDLRGKEMKYTGDLYLTHANAAPAFKNPKFKSNFSGRIIVNGQGVSLKTLDAKARIEAEASSIQNYKFKKLFLDFRASNGGVLNFDTLMVAFDKKSPIPAWADTTAENPNVNFIPKAINTIFKKDILSLGKSRGVFATHPSVALSGEIDFRNLNKLRYKFKARTHKFDLSDITLNKNNRTSLTFQIEANGSGKELDSLDGDYKIYMQEAKLPDRTLPPFNLAMTLTREGKENRTWKLNSDIADATITGKWYFSNILPTVAEGGKAITEYLMRKSKFMNEPIYNREDKPFKNEVNAQYDIQMKDLTPIEMFLEGATLQSEGNLKGEISGTPKLITFTSVGELKNFYFKKDSTNVELHNLKLDINAHNIAPGRVEEMAITDIKLRSDSTIVFNKLTFGYPDISTSLDGGMLKLRGAMSINKAVTLALDGNIDIAEPTDGYPAVLDTAIISLPNQFEWRNIGVAKVTVKPDGTILIDTAALQRNGAEITSITGSLKMDTLKDIRVNVANTDIKNVKKITEGSSIASTLQSLQGAIKEVTFTLNGTFAKPEIVGKIAIDSLAYSGVTIGNLTTELNYSDLNLTGIALIKSLDAKSKSTLKLNAESVPIDLAFASRDQRLIKDRDLKITAIGQQLPLGVAEPFLPGVKISKKNGGLVDLTYTAYGKPDKIELSGEGKVKNAHLLVQGNNMTYTANADLEFSKNILEIKNAIVQNDKFDDPQSKNSAELNGKIYFGGFNIDSIDFTASSRRIMVMSDATQSVNDLMHGPLYIATGINSMPPLRFHGTLSSPMLDGHLYILKGTSLTMPLKEEAGTKINSIIYIKNGEKEREKIKQDIENKTKDSINLNDIQDTVPKEGSLLEATKKASELILKKKDNLNQKSFSDRILYNLGIEIPTTIDLVMNFSNNSLLVDRLTASLTNKGELPLQFTRGKDGIMNMIGKVHVNEGSKYDFYFKTFNAQGDLRFTKDFLNPDLDLKATYKGFEIDETTKNPIPFQINLGITGTKKNPILSIDYDYIGYEKDPTLTKDQKERDAIGLLVLGKRFSSLQSGSVMGDVSTLSKDFVNNFSSLLANQLLDELFGNSLLKGINFDLASSKVRYSNQLGEGALTFEFNVRNQQGQAGTVTYEIPISLLGLPINFGIEVNSNIYAKETETQTGWGKIKLVFRKKF